MLKNILQRLAIDVSVGEWLGGDIFASMLLNHGFGKTCLSPF